MRLLSAVAVCAGLRVAILLGVATVESGNAPRDHRGVALIGEWRRSNRQRQSGSAVGQAEAVDRGAMMGPIVVLVLSSLVVATGVLGWLGKLPRNRFVGLRIPATRRSGEAWSVGNRAAGPLTTVGGLAAMGGSVVALLLPQQDAKGTVLVAVLVMAFLAVVGAVKGARAANKVNT